MKNFVVTYWPVLGLLAALMALSFPGWYPTGSLQQGVASNVFATFLVTPFVLFGIDRAMEAAAARRRAPMAYAIRDEAGAVVGRIVGSFAGVHYELFPADAFEAPEGPHATALPNLATHIIESTEAFRDAMPSRWADVELSVRLISDLTPRLLNIIDVGRETLPPDSLARLIKGSRHLHMAEQARSAGAGYAAQQKGVGPEELMMKVYAKRAGAPLVDAMAEFAAAYLQLLPL